MWVDESTHLENALSELGAACSSQTEGFSPSVAVSASLRTGLVLSGPDCLVVGVIFCLLVCQCLCLHTQFLGASACLNKHRFVCVYVLYM